MSEGALPVAKVGSREGETFTWHGRGLIFKGSGFYSTDYRSESYKAGCQKGISPKASEGGDKSSKTEPAKTSSSGETKAAEKKSAKESA
jgi:hypothetical protein